MPIIRHFKFTKAINLAWRKSLRNKGFLKSNPQAEFISAEENREFQGACTDGTNLFIPPVNTKKA